MSRARILGMSLKLETLDTVNINTVIAGVVYEATAEDVHNPQDIGAIYTPRFDRYGRDSVAAQYGGFRAAANWSSEMGLYGQRIEFHHYTGVGSDEIASMAKVMRRLEKVLAAREAVEGYPKDFAVYVLRVADAVGATFFVHRPHPRHDLVRIPADAVRQAINTLLPDA